MKRALSIILTLLMLLPLFANLVFALDVTDEEVSNIASEATVSCLDKNNLNIQIGNEVDLTRIIDGDRNTGTHSPRGMLYSYVLDYVQTYYFTDVIVDVCGSGTLANGETISADLCNLRSFKVILYDGNEITYESNEISVTTEPEVKIPVNAKANRIEFYKTYIHKSQNDCYVWEIETYSPKNMALCDAKLDNIEQEATFSATGANVNYWHGMDWKALTDGDTTVGTRSPKGRNYSIWMHFPQEYLMSKIDIYCNTDVGGKVPNGSVEGKYYGNQQMQICVYNFNEELVWDSDLLDTSTTTCLEVEPYIDGAIVEIKMFGSFSGGEYLWEIDVFSESGNHIFKTEDKQNPTCLVPGIKEKVCQCGKTVKESIAPTGLHVWKTEGEVISPPTEIKNGIFRVGCEKCVATKDLDIPATGHNWDSGEWHEPLCDTEGYREYKCKDEGCSASYKADFKSSFPHIWDAGKVTKKPSVTEEGITTYSCLRENCNETKTSTIKKHKYTDNTTAFNKDAITNVNITLGSAEYNEAGYNLALNGGINEVGGKVEKEIDKNYLFDNNKETYWYAPAGTVVEIFLDKEYYFTSGLAFFSGNWVSGRVEFCSKDSEDESKYVVNATFNSGNIDNGAKPGSPVEVDMADSLAGGTKASKIVITVVAAKWANGNAFKWHGFDLKVHACDITEDDYALEGDGYVAPSCTVNGKCVATCQVCGVKTNVVLEPSAKYGHKFDMNSLTVLEPATCSKDGVGKGNCTECGSNFSDVTIPATNKHSFTRNVTIMTAKCGFEGIAHKLCETCNIIGELYTLPSTGVHEYIWTTESIPSYTAIGKRVYTCKYCNIIDKIDPNTGINQEIAQKLEVPSDLLTFKGYSVRTEGFIGIRLKYQLNLDYLKTRLDAEYDAEFENNLLDTCDVRVITYITDADGNEKTVESYGKYSENKYNPTTGEFSVVIDPQSVYDEYEIHTVVRIMNFRGLELIECEMSDLNGNTDGTISVYDIAKDAVATNSTLNDARKTFYQNIIDSKPE